MTKKIVIVGHSDYKNSSVNRQLVDALTKEGVKVHILDEVYPDASYDIAAEQALLESYDEITYLFPVQWFSSPWKFKKYLDDVYTHGWAYGTANQLKGKKMKIGVTTGASEKAYKEGTTIEQCFAWLITTLKMCLIEGDIDIFPIYGVLQPDAKEYINAKTTEFVSFVKA